MSKIRMKRISLIASALAATFVGGTAYSYSPQGNQDTSSVEASAKSVAPRQEGADAERIVAVKEGDVAAVITQQGAAIESLATSTKEGLHEVAEALNMAAAASKPVKEEKSNRKDVLGALVQAGATIAAVLIGFLLSVFAERRASKRRKEEEMRDKRISAVVDLVGNLKGAVESVERGFSKVWGQNQSIAETSAAKTAQLANRQSIMKLWAVDFDQEYRSLIKCVLVLRVLNLEGQAMTLVEDLEPAMQKLQREIVKACSDPSDECGQRIGVLVESVKVVPDQLVAVALESIDVQK